MAEGGREVTIENPAYEDDNDNYNEESNLLDAFNKDNDWREMRRNNDNEEDNYIPYPKEKIDIISKRIL